MGIAGVSVRAGGEGGAMLGCVSVCVVPLFLGCVFRAWSVGFLCTLEAR